MYRTRYHFLEETTSTNDEARNPRYGHGDAICAERQSAGRGQRGHSLEPARRDATVMFSLVWEPCFRLPVSAIEVLAFWKQAWLWLLTDLFRRLRHRRPAVKLDERHLCGRPQAGRHSDRTQPDGRPPVAYDRRDRGERQSDPVRSVVAEPVVDAPRNWLRIRSAGGTAPLGRLSGRPVRTTRERGSGGAASRLPTADVPARRAASVPLSRRPDSGGPCCGRAPFGRAAAGAARRPYRRVSVPGDRVRYRGEADGSNGRDGLRVKKITG